MKKINILKKMDKLITGIIIGSAILGIFKKRKSIKDIVSKNGKKIGNKIIQISGKIVLTTLNIFKRKKK